MKDTACSALRSIDKCDIAILMIDGFEGMTDQDLKIASYIKDGGKGCIVAVNKWDLVEKIQRQQSNTLKQ